MVMESIEKIVKNLGTADVDQRLEELVCVCVRACVFVRACVCV